MRIIRVIILISKKGFFTCGGSKNGRWGEERKGGAKNGKVGRRTERCGEERTIWLELGGGGDHEFDIFVDGEIRRPGFPADGEIRKSCISACFGRRDGV